MKDDSQKRVYAIHCRSFNETSSDRGGASLDFGGWARTCWWKLDGSEFRVGPQFHPKCSRWLFYPTITHLLFFNNEEYVCVLHSKGRPRMRFHRSSLFSEVSRVFLFEKSSFPGVALRGNLLLNPKGYVRRSQRRKFQKGAWPGRRADKSVHAA